jgi:hypothetical protein
MFHLDDPYMLETFFAPINIYSIAREVRAETHVHLLVNYNLSTKFRKVPPLSTFMKIRSAVLELKLHATDEKTKRLALALSSAAYSLGN